MGDLLVTDVPAGEAELASQLLGRRSCAAGAELWIQGEMSSTLAVVNEGVVEIERDGVVIDTSGPGEVIGETSLFHRRARNATVRVVADVRLTVVDQETYAALRDRAPAVAARLERRILDQQIERLRRLDLRIGEAGGDVRRLLDRPGPGVFERILALLRPAQAPRGGPPVDVAVALAKSALFADEPASILGVLSTRLEQRGFGVGEFLVRQGEPGSSVLVLVSGRADVIVHRPGDGSVSRVGLLRPGDACGFTSMADGRGRIASVVATEDVGVLVLDRALWLRWLGESSRLASTVRAAMIRAYATQLADAGGRLAAAITGQEFAEAAAGLEHSGTAGRSTS